MRWHSAAWIFVAIASAAMSVSEVQAYSVASGVSDPCHETITVLSVEEAIAELPIAGRVPPSDGKWTKVLKVLMKTMNFNFGNASKEELFWLTSLLVGARAPNTDGHSVMDLENLHRLHSDPTAIGQYAHCLRGLDDDYSAGDAAAIAGTRLLIFNLVNKSQSYLSLAPKDQIIRADFYFDFYGLVSIEVSAPFYYLGRAVHAIQDCFSHTIRSEEDGFQKIVHVLNYVDAISSNHQEHRDGLAHSDSMDKCMDEDLSPIFDAAVTATGDLLTASISQLNGADPDAVSDALDKWLTLKQGCTQANDFCNNGYWLKIVRQAQTEPYLREIFGCTSVPRSPTTSSGGCILIVLGLLLAIRLLRRV